MSELMTDTEIFVKLVERWRARYWAGQIPPIEQAVDELTRVNACEQPQLVQECFARQCREAIELVRLQQLPSN